MTIHDQIWSQRNRLMAQGLEPTAVYLGRDEFMSLKADPHFYSRFRRGTEQETVFGLPVFELIAPSHLRVA